MLECLERPDFDVELLAFLQVGHGAFQQLPAGAQHLAAEHDRRLIERPGETLLHCVTLKPFFDLDVLQRHGPILATVHQSLRLDGQAWRIEVHHRNAKLRRFVECGDQQVVSGACIHDKGFVSAEGVAIPARTAGYRTKLRTFLYRDTGDGVAA